MWNEILKVSKAKKLSKYRISKLTGIPQSTLRSYELGAEPSFKNIAKVAQVLGISLDELIKKIDKE